MSHHVVLTTLHRHGCETRAQGRPAATRGPRWARCWAALGAALALAACAQDPGPEDPGAPAACDPLTSTGCGPAEKCSVRVESESPYITTVDCVPDGVQGIGAGCGFEDPGPYGTDDCQAGGFCLDGVCAPICDPHGAGCASAACVRYQGLFEDLDLGVCTPQCSPIDIAACGDEQGCYLRLGTGVSTCHRAGVGSQGERCEFIDACSPGLGCVLLAPDQEGSLCTAFCDPGSGLTAGGASCAEALGAGAGDPRCVAVNQFYSDTPLVPDEIGMCLDCAVAEYAAFAVCTGASAPPAPARAPPAQGPWLQESR